MSFEAHILEPNHNASRDDIVGVYALPFAATMQNSGDRLQAMVDAAGFPFIVSDLNLQHQREIFGMPARVANQPAGEIYRSMSLHRVDFVAKEAERYPGSKLLGMSDSLAVPTVQGMALHGDSPFDALLLRDGWNLDPQKRTIVRGMIRYVGYTLRDKTQEMKRHKPPSIPYSHWSESTPTVVDETSLLEKMRNVADLMGSQETNNNAIKLAKHLGNTGVAMNVIVFANGLCGTAEQQQVFVNTLNRASNSPAVKAAIADGWHSDLLDPIRAANDVDATIRLLEEAG